MGGGVVISRVVVVANGNPSSTVVEDVALVSSVPELQAPTTTHTTTRRNLPGIMTPSCLPQQAQDPTPEP